MKFLYFFTLLFFSISAFSQINRNADVEAHFRINGKENGMLKPGAPSTIEVWFTDKQTGETFTDFKIMHGKIMHMVLIRHDLSVFKHIHPYLDPITGRFQITINMPLADPDNYQTASTITEGGMYMVMADVEIRHVGMRMGHKMVHAMGTHSQVPLTKDNIDSSGFITKDFSFKNIDYRAKLKVVQTAGCSGNLVDFHLDLFVKNESGEYEVVMDAEEWLMAGGHSVWASEGLMHGHHMYYAHMHSNLPDYEAGLHQFVYSFHDDNIMKPGIQKVWFQIKHRGSVLTIPMTFDYKRLPEGC